MSKAKFDYVMDYIDDKNLFKAVMWARKMHREGKDMSQAIRTASKYYDVDMSDVAHYIGQVGNRKKQERNQR